MAEEGGKPSAQGASAGSQEGRPRGEPPSLSLPKGGGALRGMGEKFATHPSNGTASLSIPIATSPGRSGFGPQLSLDYDSGAPNGPFGIGWHLAVPAITRKTDKGLPRYLDAEESDVFILSGAEDLVPLRDGGGAVVVTPRDGYAVVRYRPRVEGLFARIERWTRVSDGDTHWRATTRENLTSIYGRDPAARIADPEAPWRVFSWLLEESRDDRGNVMRYGYQGEDGAGVDPAAASEANRFERHSDGTRRFLATAQRYLKTIWYGNRVPVAAGDPAPGGDGDWLFQVVLDYGEHDPARPTPTAAAPWPVRSDPFSSGRSAFEVRTYRLCRRVLMFHRFEELGAAPCLVRSTDLAYPAASGDPGWDERRSLTFLSSVTHASYRADGAGGYVRAALPPLALGYALPELHDELRELAASDLEGIPAGVEGAGVQWIDLDGEGIPGALIAQPNAWYYKPSLGDGRLAPPTALGRLPSPADLHGGLQTLSDVDGDGRLELVSYAQPLAGWFSRTAAGWTPFGTFPSLPALDWRDPNLRMLDLDGDGHADVLITENDLFVWYRSRAKDGFEPAAVVTHSRDEELGPAVLFADGTETLFLADMTGDGLVDLVRVRNGEVCYWANLGYGRFGRKVTLEGSPQFDRIDQFDPRRIRLADVDGSGTADVLYLGRDGVDLYFNQAGNALADRRTLRALPAADSLAGTSVVDLLGTGTACLVWSSPAPARDRRPIAYVDLMGGRKPNLLTSIDNNLGAETKIHYAPSTRFYLADKAAGQPWITRLPFPVQVVERVDTYDRVSRNRFVTSHAYHHGFYDGVEREFRGFGRIDNWDTEAWAALTADGTLPDGDNFIAESHVPPVLTRSWFHTGAFAGARRISRLYAHEYFREPGLGDDDFAAQLLPDTELPGTDPDDAREACRALKGSLLRQETYALDGTDKSANPYSVSERSYSVVQLQPRGDGRYGVFFAHAAESLEYHYERNPADPRIGHSLTLAVDAFGNVLESAAIGYGRRAADADLSTVEAAAQTQTLIKWSRHDFTNAIDDAQTWRTPAPAESREYEVTALPLAPRATRYSAADFAGAAALPAIGYEETPTLLSPQKRLLADARTIYRRDDLTAPLALGRLESRALPAGQYQLAFTPALLTARYAGRVSDTMLSSEGGYVHLDGDANWWAPSGSVFYSAAAADSPAVELATAQAHFFLPRRFQDPFGASATVAYDRYDLLPLETVDAAGNRVTAGERAADDSLLQSGIDYRVLSPALLTDANRNRSAVAFDTRGLVVGTAVMGKPGETVGDSLAGFQTDLTDAEIAAHLNDPLASAADVLGRASTRVIYDLFAWQRTRGDAQPQPSVACVLARETHDAELAGAPPRIQIALSYSDGFGREIQKKSLVEPDASLDPRWVASGWTIFNNKGKPVRQYEPFFTASHQFELANLVGVSAILFYDPVSRVIATVHPNQTWEKVVFDPWKQETWDVNDTVGQLDPASDADVGDWLRRLPAADLTPTWLAQRQSGALGTAEQAAAQKALVHDGTSTLAYFDALGRQFLTIAHNRWLLDGVTTDDRPRTRLDLDIDGQQRREIDALDRVVMRLDGALLKAKSHQASMESGERWLLDDVTGKVIYLWDSLQRIFRTEYDPLRRPLAVRVTGADTLDPTRVILQRRTEYGEGAPNDSMLNLRGRVSRAYDEAGVVTHAEYDFKGNLLRGQRQLTSEYRALIDWSAPVALADIFTSSTRYDALNRAIEKTTPDGTVSHLTYDRGGHLQQVEADLQGTTPTVFVETIEYDAKGRRRRIEYGNGAITSYEYDPRTFRLTHLQTTRGAPFNDDCQDLHYTFDPAGNITAIRDDAQQTIYFRNRRVEPSAEYTYDATYRLIEAMGREHLGQLAGGALQPPTATSPDDAPRVGLPHPGDGNAVGLYVQRYAYDRAGNIVTMIHRGSDPLNPGWTRTYSYSEPSQLEPGKVNNRLTSTQVGSDPALPYSHDIHGNMIAMPHLSAMSWDCHDRLQSTARQAAGAPATTYYVYDSGGQRVRKATDAATRSERIYLGGFETYREYATDGITVTLERQTLHVMDDHHRIAIVETRTQGTDPSPAQLIRHQFGNHLDSAALELDPTGAVISYEEYYPYGSSSYQALNTETPKRYRYTSKERDDETGFNYHGARYYAPWLARWTSADPQLLGDGPNLFVYCRNNPIVGVDPNGYQTVVVPGAQSGAPVPPPAGGAIPPTPPRPPTPPAPPAPAETVPDSSGNYGLTTFQGGSANLRLHWTGEFDYIHFGSTSSRAESHNYYLGVRYGFSDHFTGGLALTPSTSRDPTGVSSSTTVVSAVGDISGVENDPAGHPLLRYHLFPSIGLTTLAGGGVAPTGGVIGGVESAGDNNHMVGGNVSVAAAPEGSAVAPGTPPLVTPVTVGATVATQHQLGPFTISAEVFAAIVIAGVRGSIRGAEELRVGWDVAVGLARPGTRGPNRQPAGGIQVMVGAVHSVDYFGTAPLPADQVFIGIGGSLTGP